MKRDVKRTKMTSSINQMAGTWLGEGYLNTYSSYQIVDKQDVSSKLLRDRHRFHCYGRH